MSVGYTMRPSIVTNAKLVTSLPTEVTSLPTEVEKMDTKGKRLKTKERKSTMWRLKKELFSWSNQTLKMLRHL